MVQDQGQELTYLQPHICARESMSQTSFAGRVEGGLGVPSLGFLSWQLGGLEQTAPLQESRLITLAPAV